MIRRLSLSVILLSLLFLGMEPVQAHVTCKSFFAGNFPTLPLRDDVETNNILKTIARNWVTHWQDRGSQSPIKTAPAAKLEAEKALRQYFKNDPHFTDLPDDIIEQAVQRTLNWRILTESETISNRAALEIERHSLYLQKLGLIPTHGKWEEAFKQAGINYVTHGTSLTNLLQILTDQKITPRPSEKHSNMGGEAKYVYVELPSEKTRGLRPTLERDGTGKYTLRALMSQDGAYILLSPSVFDRTNWSHGNGFWQHGELNSQFSFVRPSEVYGLLNFLKNNFPIEFFPGERFTPEWMFTEPIDLQKVDFRIIVHPDSKEQFKEKALEIGIPVQIVNRIE